MQGVRTPSTIHRASLRTGSAFVWFRELGCLHARSASHASGPRRHRDAEAEAGRALRRIADDNRITLPEYIYIYIYGKASYIVAFSKYRGIARARRLPEKRSDYQYRGIARARRQNRPIYVTPAFLNLLRPAIHLNVNRAYIVACIAPGTVLMFSPG